MAKLKPYVDSDVTTFSCPHHLLQMNGIEFEEVVINIAKGQHRSPEFKEINPMGLVPAIVDGRFKLFESHAILRYLACAFPSVGDRWFPADLSKRASIDSVLDWHHSNLRRGAGSGKFLLGSLKPSIADLSFVCEIMQLEVVDENDRDRILSPHEKVLQSIKDVKKATNPHFEEVHTLLYKTKARVQNKQSKL